MKSLELTYEELGVLLDLTLLSNAETCDEPTIRLLGKLGDLYRQFTGKETQASETSTSRNKSKHLHPT
jgi:hypothetical protein